MEMPKGLAGLDRANSGAEGKEIISHKTLSNGIIAKLGRRLPESAWCLVSNNHWFEDWPAFPRVL
jgi:hypothetical protein